MFEQRKQSDVSASKQSTVAGSEPPRLRYQPANAKCSFDMTKAVSPKVQRLVDQNLRDTDPAKDPSALVAEKQIQMLQARLYPKFTPKATPKAITQASGTKKRLAEERGQSKKEAKSGDSEITGNNVSNGSGKVDKSV